MMPDDYTKIDIKFDPLKQLMIGTTHHKQMDFAVPFISHIIGNLYVGGCRNGLLLPANIEYVVSLYKWEQYTYHDAVKAILTITAYDDDINDLVDQLTQTALIASEFVQKGPTLVHCQAGLNRANLIACMVLQRIYGMSPIDAISVLRDKRHEAVLCNSSFEKWLLDNPINM